MISYRNDTDRLSGVLEGIDRKRKAEGSFGPEPLQQLVVLRPFKSLDIKHLLEVYG
jgi:hypothetical protein